MAARQGTTGLEGSSDTRVFIDHITVLCRPREGFQEWIESRKGTKTVKSGEGRESGTWQHHEYGYFATRRAAGAAQGLVAYAFNPQTVDEYHIAQALSHLVPIRVTRIDVALEDFFDIPNSRVTFPQRKVDTVKRATGALETIAFGVRGNRRYYRLYDRYLAADAPQGTWRIEVEHKPLSWQHPLPLGLFDGLTIEQWPSTKRKHIVNKAVVGYARTASATDLDRIRRHGSPQVLDLLDQVHPLTPSVNEIYQQHRPRLIEELDWILRLGGTVPDDVVLFDMPDHNPNGDTDV